MCYTQLFNLLCEKADDVWRQASSPCALSRDEAANIGQIPRLKKLVATIRAVKIRLSGVAGAESAQGDL